jgi:1-phosphofructokinase family hexose kinase
VIVVAALNPALDVTHHVAGVDWAGVNRPGRVGATAGGKGLNVARTLHALGCEVLLLGLAGGVTGAAVRTWLTAAGVPSVFTEIAADTRRTFAVVDTERGHAALFNEPGPPIRQDEYARFVSAYEQALAGCSAVVLSGSLPGLRPDSYAGLIRIAAGAGVPAILDTSGDALLPGVAAGPAIIKPNLAELSAAVGRDLHWAASDQAPVVRAAAELRDRGAGAVVVSMSADGLLAVTGEGTWHAAAPPVTGNPTGAGDAVVAGLARGLGLGHGWPARLREAAALGAAAAAAPSAGEFLSSDLTAALAAVRVTELEPA